jgi:hypothetical protein
MAGTITPLAGKLSFFKIGSTSYQFSKWSLKITLDTGEVLHFDSQTDGAGNYWPTTFANFAKGEGEVSGFVDHATNIVPVAAAASVYIGNTGTFACLWSTTDGFTFPGRMKGNDFGADAAGKDPGAIGCAFEMTGPPTRVFS